MYVYAYVLKDHEAAFRWLTDLLIKKAQSLVKRKPSLDTSSSFSGHSIGKLFGRFLCLCKFLKVVF